MEQWKKTSCVLCAQNCGLEVLVENNRIVKVRGDKKNPRSRGYFCNKGMNVAWHQHHAGRLTHPLKKTPQGFEKISWEQAVSEISEKLKGIVDEHGPRSYAYMGGGGQGCHCEAAFGLTLMRNLGSRYNYNALAQELTGYFWGCGRVAGRQNRFLIPHEEGAEMIIAIGWNGMLSHQMPRAPLVLKEFSKNPDKILAVIDPRKSETAEIADIHIPVRPGADALLFKAMIAIILKEGLEDRSYIEKYVTGFDEVASIFKDFDVEEALKICQVDYDSIHDFCVQLTTRKWCFHTDLGVLMNRHSTITTWLVLVLTVICGRAGVEGGNVIPGSVVPLGSHSDERDPNSWRTVETDFPAILGAFPPNVMPEEILSDKPDRLRAVIACASNPLRSYADTTAYEEAFSKLELLVTIELAMTETAALADYVLPAQTGFESIDTTFFPWTYPEIYFQMRTPVVKPKGEQLECGEIFTRIGEGLGQIPDLPDYLIQAAKKDLFQYTMAFFTYMQKNPKSGKAVPFILAKTLGAAHNSAHFGALFGIMLAMPPKSRKNCARAGFKMKPAWKTFLNPVKASRAVLSAARYRSIAPLMALSPQIDQSLRIFNSILEHPEGIWLGKVEAEKNMDELKTADGKFNIYIPEMDKPAREITAESEKKELEDSPDYPFVLHAGRHMKFNANTLMRDPEWMKGRRACTMLINPDDAEKLGISDGQKVKIVTEAASEEIEAEISESARTKQVVIPHGFGLVHEGETYGVNVNRLTKNTNRDFLAATPLHRYVPCRIETS